MHSGPEDFVAQLLSNHLFHSYYPCDPRHGEQAVVQLSFGTREVTTFSGLILLEAFYQFCSKG
jgi:hypothetical protein